MKRLLFTVLWFMGAVHVAYAASAMSTVSANVMQAVTAVQNVDGTYTIPDGFYCTSGADGVMCFY